MKTFNAIVILLMAGACNGQSGIDDQYVSGTTSIVKTQGGDKYSNIHALIQDKQGNIWAGTIKEGVYRYDGKTFTQFTNKDGLSDNTVYSLLADTAGNVWIGTKNGLNKYDGKRIQHIPILLNDNSYLSVGMPAEDPSSKENEIWSMMQTKDGLLWFGARSGLYCYDGRSFTRFVNRPGLKNEDTVQLKMVDCMFEAQDGTIWLGSGMIPGDEGICRYYPHTKKLIRIKPGGDGWIRYMLQDKKGIVWIGTRHVGIWCYDGKAFSRYMKGDDIGLSALADRNGNLWFSGGEKDDGYSSAGGIWRYDGDSLKQFSSNTLGGYSVWSMLQDKAGNIWFGTRNNGLYKYDGNSFTSYSE